MITVTNLTKALISICPPISQSIYPNSSIELVDTIENRGILERFGDMIKIENTECLNKETPINPDPNPETPTEPDGETGDKESEVDKEKEDETGDDIIDPDQSPEPSTGEEDNKTDESTEEVSALSLSDENTKWSPDEEEKILILSQLEDLGIEELNAYLDKAGLPRKRSREDKIATLTEFLSQSE